MNNYLSNLVARSTHRANVMQPRLPARFEPIVSGQFGVKQPTVASMFEVDDVNEIVTDSSLEPLSTRSNTQRRSTSHPMTQHSKELESPELRETQSRSWSEIGKSKHSIQSPSERSSTPTQVEPSLAEPSNLLPQRANAPALSMEKPEFSSKVPASPSIQVLQSLQVLQPHRPDDLTSHPSSLQTTEADTVLLNQEFEQKPAPVQMSNVVRESLVKREVATVRAPKRQEGNTSWVQEPSSPVINRNERVFLPQHSGSSLEPDVQPLSDGTVQSIKPSIEPSLIAPVPALAKRLAFKLPTKTAPEPLPTPTIQVTIGRIEVRATPAPASPTPRSTAKPPVVSLEDYLHSQAKGGGG